MEQSSFKIKKYSNNWWFYIWAKEFRKYLLYLHFESLMNDSHHRFLDGYFKVLVLIYCNIYLNLAHQGTPSLHKKKLKSVSLHFVSL